ncbi:MAG: DUF2442 domain-containing protein [Coriobacteriia bacterium]|nr:DUF2442 domain-containing protein [Coriobacteriia bacterium]
MADLSFLLCDFFSTGEVRLFDASSMLRFPVFGSLRDTAVFRTFFIDHGVLCWRGGTSTSRPKRCMSRAMSTSLLGSWSDRARWGSDALAGSSVAGGIPVRLMLLGHVLLQASGPKLAKIRRRVCAACPIRVLSRAAA